MQDLWKVQLVKHENQKPWQELSLKMFNESKEIRGLVRENSFRNNIFVLGLGVFHVTDI